VALTFMSNCRQSFSFFNHFFSCFLFFMLYPCTSALFCVFIVIFVNRNDNSNSHCM